jgi:hypothetical protein
MDRKIRVAVCGGSYCSAEKNGPRDHFSQILTDMYGYDVINLARAGMSNTGICWQIREAVLELRVDVVVHTAGGSDRVDIIMNEKFSLVKGLKNFVYAYPTDSSYQSPYVGGSDASVFSTPVQNLDVQKHVPLSQAQLEACKVYLTHFFDLEFCEEVDQWQFGFWESQMKERGIVSIPLTNDNFARVIFEFVEQNPDWPRNYHTDRGTQEIVAKHIDQLIQKRMKRVDI